MIKTSGSTLDFLFESSNSLVHTETIREEWASKCCIQTWYIVYIGWCCSVCLTGMHASFSMANIDVRQHPSSQNCSVCHHCVYMRSRFFVLAHDRVAHFAWSTLLGILGLPVVGGEPACSVVGEAAWRPSSWDSWTWELGYWVWIFSHNSSKSRSSTIVISPFLEFVRYEALGGGVAVMMHDGCRYMHDNPDACWWQCCDGATWHVADGCLDERKMVLSFILY
jgi:hypothetical protein